MLKKTNRSHRVAHEIQKKISIILQQNIQDPRIINMTVTVSDVMISSDLEYAKVFVSFAKIQNKKDINTNIKTLQHAAGFIRLLLGKTMCLRIIPIITFVHDPSLLEGIRISDLVTRIKKYDETYRIKSDNN